MIYYVKQNNHIIYGNNTDKMIFENDKFECYIKLKLYPINTNINNIILTDDIKTK